MLRARTVFLSLFALALLAGGIFALSRIEKRETVQSDNRAVAEATAKAAEILAKDADSDTLKDWEEELWKTDPQNPDSDGDGALDGEEILLGRDPLKAGPNDLLDRETVEKKTTSGGGAGRELTLSEQIARELFAQYMAAKQSGKPFTAENEKQILLHFFDNSPPLKTAVRYNEKDIVASAGGAEGLHAYGNGLAAILLKYSSAESENELVTLQEAVDEEDESKLEKLKSRRVAYQEALADLLVLPTPKEIITLHLDLLHALAAMEAGVGGMELIFKDPVRSLETIGQYPQGLDQFYNTVSAIGNFLIEKKIEFGANEAGAQLIR